MNPKRTPRTSIPSSLSDSTRTFTSHERFLAGIGAKFFLDPVKYGAFADFLESLTAFRIDKGVRSNDSDGHTGAVAPKRDKGVGSRSGRKGVLTRKQREHANLVRSNGGACASCRLRKVKVCTND